MSDTPKPPDPGGTAPPPPSTPPPPAPEAPPPAGPPPAPGNKTLMLVLSYLWILGLIPLLAEPNDKDVQWHAKNGLLITAAEFVAQIACFIISFLPFIGWLIGCGLSPLIFLVFVIVRIIGIIKATKGEKLMFPVVSDYVEQWK